MFISNIKTASQLRTSHMNHLSGHHKWRILDNIERHKQITKSRRLGPGHGSNRHNILKMYKNESHKNEPMAHISYLHLRNGNINTPMTFSQQCLCAHNYIRRLHNVPKLRWSVELSREAQNQADKLASMIVSSDLKKKDENIYVDSIVDLSTSCRRAVQFWYSESKKYNYTENRVSNDTGIKLIICELVYIRYMGKVEAWRL